MAKLIVEQGAMELSDSDLDEESLLGGSLHISCNLSRIVYANVVVKKKNLIAAIKWSCSFDGTNIIVPVSRGENKRRNKRVKRGDEKKPVRGGLAIGDVVIWNVYGE